MQGRKVTLFLVIIFVISVIPITEIGINSAETITTSVKWSGTKEIDNDIIIKSGAQLTIEDGTTVKINADILISVEGSLIIEGTGIDGVKFISNISQQSELGSKSTWEGIQIQNTGIAEINGMSLNGSRNAIYTNPGSTLDIQNSIIHESMEGIINYGTSTINSISCLEIQNTCITNEGSITVNGLTSNNSGQLLKHNNSGTFTDLLANNTGVVLEVLGGASGSLETIDTISSGLVLRAYGDQSGMTYSGIDANLATQLFDFSNSVSLSINDVEGTSIESVLLANSVNSLEISDMVVSDSESVGLAMEASTSDTVIIRDSIINGYGQSFSFSGGGHFYLNSMAFLSNGKVGQISSSELSISNGTWEGKSHGLDAQYSSINTFNTNISVGENHGTALRILGGDLSVNGDLNLTHEAQWADTTSIGLQLIWSHIIATSVNIEGFSTGFSCETTSTTAIDSLSIMDNTNIGYFQACSESQIESLNTNFGDYGLYSKSGQISITDWIASSHTSSLLFTESTAKTYIRDWGGTGFTFAGQGEADELFYGSTEINENLIQVAGAEKYTETNIEITDLSGTNTLDGIEVSVHNFYDISDINGIVTLPLVGQDTDVYAIDSEQSISRMKSLSTSDVNPRIELPVLPSDGSDWIIESGVNIVLDGFSGELLSNISIQDGGSLNLIGSSLTALNVSIESGGILIGTDSNFIGEEFSISSSEIGDESSSLFLEGLIEVNCELVNMNWHGITLNGDVNLITSSNCELSLFGGGLIGSTTISQGGSIVQFTNLLVSVVDQGEPISSAFISLDGIQENNEIISATTDLTGTANLRAKSVTYNESGIFEDEDLDRIVTMEIGQLEITQINYWDVSDNSEMTFIASTVNTDEVSNYLNLDLEWSPYYLFDDLVVSGLMEIDNGVDLQISTNKGITIKGELNVGSASLHGVDWAGLLVEGGEINFEGTYLLNAVQSLKLVDSAIAELVDITFYNSINGHIMIDDGSSVTLKDSSLELGDDCIKTSNHLDNSLEIVSSNISLCNVGIRATGTQINFNQLSMYGLDTGIRAVAVDGSISNIIMDEIDTTGLQILDQMNDLILSNIDLKSDSVALSVEDSVGVQISFGDISNVELMRSSVSFDNLIVDEINIADSRAAELILFENLISNNINALGNSGQSCISLISSNVTSISLEDLCVNMVGGEVNELIINSSFETLSSLESTSYNIVTMKGLAELNMIHTHLFLATLEGTTVDANFELTQENTISSVQFSGSKNQTIIWKKFDSNGFNDYSNTTLLITFNGALPYSTTVQIGPSFELPIFELELNPSPIISLILPEGLDRISEGSITTPSGAAAEINYTAIDEHGISSIMWILINLDTNEETHLTSDSAYSLSELPEGEYSISLGAIDNYGAMSVATEFFTITPSDFDGDDIDTCISELWWDDVNQRKCGPDNVDEDDDNDGYVDTIDAFPFDSCAHKDTDSDGEPDEIVENCETNLILDEDADGNGVIDVNEISVESDESSGNSAFFVWALLLLVIGGALFRRFRLNEV
ncbi:MAG: hypothetical protein CMB48_05130 [Euryarchaeota archaeon]|nr:hypothetical protein [Euryarchaeota archaeon]